MKKKRKRLIDEILMSVSSYSFQTELNNKVIILEKIFDYNKGYWIIGIRRKDSLRYFECSKIQNANLVILETIAQKLKDKKNEVKVDEIDFSILKEVKP